MPRALRKSASRGARLIAWLLKRASWRVALLFACLLLPLWAFAELAEEVHEFERFVFDDPLLLGAHAVAGPGLDRVFLWLSRVGYEGVIVFDAGLVLVLLALRRWREATFAAVAFVGSALLNVATKGVFQRDRPTLWDSIAPETSFSFPSGHAMGSITVATVTVLLAWHTRWRWPVLLAALSFVLLVGASRVYLGVHYPSDIIGGWAAGLAWVFGVYIVFYGGLFHGEVPFGVVRSSGPHRPGKSSAR